MDDNQNNTQPTSDTTTNAPTQPDLDIDVTYEDDGEGLEALNGIFGGGDEDAEDKDADDKEATPPAAAKPTEATQKPANTALERAKQRYEQRLAARNKKDEVAELKKAKEELEAKLNRDLTPAEIRAASVKYLEQGKTPEQLKIEEREREFEELKAWKAEQENEKKAALKAQERAEEVSFIASEIERMADTYPFASSRWSPEEIYDIQEALIENGEAEDLEGAFQKIEHHAKAAAEKFRGNKRALKAMLSAPETQQQVLEILEELGVAPTAKNRNAVRRAMQQSAPTTLSNELKGDFNPQDDNKPLSADERLRRMQKLADQLGREGAL